MTRDHPHLHLPLFRQMLDGSAELLRKIWNMSGVDVLEHTATCQGHEGRINSLAWSRNDAKIATGGERELWAGVSGIFLTANVHRLTLSLVHVRRRRRARDRVVV